MNSSLYKQPFINADLVVADEGLILIRGSKQSLIEISNNDKNAIELIRKLHSDRAFLQSTLNGSPETAAHVISVELDRLGWICDAAPLKSTDTNVLQNEILATVDAIRFEAKLLGDLEQQRFQAVLQMLDIPNAFRGKQPTQSRSGLLLKTFLCNWRHRSSPSYWISTNALRELAAVEQLTVPDTFTLEHYDIYQVRAEVSAFVFFLRNFLIADVSLYKTSVCSVNCEQSGINAMIIAEDTIEKYMLDHEIKTPLFKFIRAGEKTFECARSIFIHQYFVTWRYLECLMVFLTNRLPGKLRREALSYLHEETGHDLHELKACKEFGLTEDEVYEFQPSPFFIAFTERLEWLARHDIVAFCMAVAIAEGMPGQRKSLVDQIVDSGFGSQELATHINIDMELSHSIFPRRLMSCFPSLTAMQVNEALYELTAVLELSQEAWSYVLVAAKMS